MLVLWERRKSTVQKRTSTAFQGESKFVVFELMSQVVLQNCRERERERTGRERMSKHTHEPSGLLSISSLRTLVSPNQPTEPIICDPGLPRGQHRENLTGAEGKKTH